MSLKIKYHKNAFTLIELLVVIAIIGILATLLIANINASRGRARDANRKADLRNIQTALRLYYNDYGVYPDNSGSDIAGCGTGGTGVCVWGEAFATDEQTYMSILPADPLPDGRTYVYDRDDSATDLYTLKACLENKSDDKCTGQEVWCTGYDGCVYLVQP
jgi:prepilin-type N-terminal cleavage/methylation domain-containing protein